MLNIYWIFFWSFISALSVMFSINRFQKCAIQSSAGLTILLCLFSYFVNNGFDYANIIFGASFIGMSLREKFHYRDIFLASILFVFIYTYLIQPKHLPSVGGILGFSAFISLLVIQLGKMLKSR